MENNQNKIDLRQFTRKEILDLKGLIYDGKLPLSEQDQHFVNALRGSFASYKDIP